MSADFLDTNVLVYLFDETDARKRAIAERIVGEALAEGTGCIGHQVIQETLNVLTRKLARPADLDSAQRIFEAILLPLWRGAPTAALYRRGLAVQARWKLSLYDALIVAAALEAGCSRLLSEDLQHGLKIDGLRVENPFRRS